MPTFSSMMVDTNDPGNPSTAQVSNIIILVHSYTHRYLPFLSIGSGSVSCPYSRASQSHAGFISQVVPGYPQVELGNAGSQKIVQDPQRIGSFVKSHLISRAALCMLKLLNKWTLEWFRALLGASPIIATASLPPWSASLTFHFTSMCMKLLWGSWRAGLGVIMDTFHNFVFKLTCVHLSITSIQAGNHDMIQAWSYWGMQTRNPLTANYQYHLLPTDNVTLYRKFSQQHGVNVWNLPQYNIYMIG